MYNSITVFLFSVIVAIFAFSAAYSVSMLNRSIERSSTKIVMLNNDVDRLHEIIEYININTDTQKKPETIIDGEITITFLDISSRLDLNFIDFTIFKTRSFRSLLKQKYTWLSLQDFRDELGFTSDINIYRDFFVENINFESLFTVYSLPNINNMSDIMLEQYYIAVTEDESKALSLKNYLQNSRKSKKVIDNRELKRLITIYGEELQDFITVIPSWNKENMHKDLLDKSRYISKKSKKFYIGDKTTFWYVTIYNKSTELNTTIILKWLQSEELYQPISIIKDFI